MRKILSKEFLRQHWNISRVEKKLISNKNRASKLIVIAKIKYLKLENRFPESMEDISPTAVRYIAKQLDLTSEDAKNYLWNRRASRKHSSFIKNFLNYNDYTTLTKQGFVRWLLDEKLSAGATKAKILGDSSLYFKENKILTPSSGKLERDISSIIKKFDQVFFENISSSLSKTAKPKLVRRKVRSQFHQGLQRAKVCFRPLHRLEFSVSGESRI